MDHRNRRAQPIRSLPNPGSTFVRAYILLTLEETAVELCHARVIFSSFQESKRIERTNKQVRAVSGQECFRGFFGWLAGLVC
jgi:hypothetical protein